MCGAAACAFNASALSQVSSTTKASGPIGAWNPPKPSASTKGWYSMQPVLGVDVGHVGAKQREHLLAAAGIGGDDGDDSDHGVSLP